MNFIENKIIHQKEEQTMVISIKFIGNQIQYIVNFDKYELEKDEDSCQLYIVHVHCILYI